ncbi:MAG TPA: hypothetical protein VFU86_02060 [Terriglobales bacterium]|nr:hypothetical protein [Terriglobales bacterium]
MTLFENTLTLRGFLGTDADVPHSDDVQHGSYAVLTLCIESGAWKKAANEWRPRTAWFRIICPGPYFCGFIRGMKQGDYVEVEGQLHVSQHDRPVIIAGKAVTDKRPACEVYATRVRRLEHPSVGVEEDEDG